MGDFIVRIEHITIENLKNVEYGSINLTSKSDYKASVLGLYGQNGSGKTTLIESLSLLKHAILGIPLPNYFADFINVNSEYANIKYKLSIKNKINDDFFEVEYSFSIKKRYSEVMNDGASYKTMIFDEILSYSSMSNGKKTPMRPLISTKNYDDLFGPQTKYEILVGKNKDINTDVIVAKKLSSVTSRSFIFSSELYNLIRQNCSDKNYLFILSSIIQYGNTCLFVFQNKNTALIGLNAIPLSFKIESERVMQSIIIPIDEKRIIPKDDLSIVEKVIDNMNIVLKQLVPGLTIDIKIIGEEIKKDGNTGCRIQMLSCKNKKSIPLSYESDGIKKIVAILYLLIVVFNDPSITVIIDDLDSGIFEYLLGEILAIISKKGKGQLVFTSHNLRPLETLNKSFIAFTTTNPKNRYIRFTNVKSKNNLRDFYYRDIILGEQSEIVYERTNNHEIALAFKEAVDFNDI